MLLFYLNLIEDEIQKRKFEDIYYEYRFQMFFLAQKILKNDADAEDVVHDVFMKIAVKHMPTVESIEDSEDLRNYLLKATKNTALNMKKKKERSFNVAEKIREMHIEKNKNLLDKEFVTELCNKMTYDKLLDTMMNMSDTYKEVLYYHFVLGMTAKETAEFLDRKVSTVKKQIVRGKKLLLEQAEKEGFEYANESE